MDLSTTSMRWVAYTEPLDSADVESHIDATLIAT